MDNCTSQGLGDDYPTHGLNTRRHCGIYDRLSRASMNRPFNAKL